MLIPQYQVLVLKLSPIYTVSLNTVFSIPQNQCYPGTPCIWSWFWEDETHLSPKRHLSIYVQNATSFFKRKNTFLCMLLVIYFLVAQQYVILEVETLQCNRIILGKMDAIFGKESFHFYENTFLHYLKSK